MKLHIMKGLPGSGKSTLAKAMVDKDGNTVRINRDDLRAMCFNSKWSGQKEKFIIAAEKALVLAAQANNNNVIIDDTNLNPAMWLDFAKVHGFRVELHDLTTKVSLAECIRRDALRDKPVGRPVIERMAFGANLIKFDKPIIVCDIDGTIADLTHRLFCLDKTPKDFESFFELVFWDSPIRPIIRWVRELAEDHTIVLVSGRPDTCFPKTGDWLEWHGIPFHHIMMRRGGDHRPDDMVKAEIAKLLPHDKVEFVIDDRPRVIRMWREKGFRVIPVNQEAWEGKGD